MRIDRPSRDHVSAATRAVEETYEGRYRHFTRAHRRCVRREKLWSATRLATFILGVAALVLALDGAAVSPWGYICMALVAGFIIAVFQHLRAQSEAAHQLALATVNAEARHKLYRRWDEIRPMKAPPATACATELADLHIVGEGSLTHWLNTVATPGGRQLLMEWLAAPGCAGEIERRQAAVRELAPALDHRQEFFAIADQVRKSTDDDAGLLHWATAPLDPMPPYFVVLLLSAGTVITGVLDLMGLTSVHWWLPLAAINIALSARYSRSIKEELALVDRANTRLVCYSQLIRQADRRKHQSALLVEIQRRFRLDGETQSGRRTASQLIDKLQRWVSWAELRHVGLYYIFAQPLLLWDFHCIRLLRGWRKHYGKYIKHWFDALSRYEILCTAASVRHDHADWCFPDFRADALTFRAAELGHPLISELDRVCNDVRLGPDKRLILLSGSNMSGKSTLLRTIGCNMMLARCGAPVCAQSMQCRPMHVLTCFNVQDSLKDGTSLFMAELMRMKEIVNAIEENTANGLETFYLLDEILHGTNSRERRIAVTIILERLLALKALGLISTHDLQLAGDASVSAHAIPFHFREYMEHAGDELVMRFDYRLKQGEASSSNALALLKAVGIGEGRSLPES